MYTNLPPPFRRRSPPRRRGSITQTSFALVGTGWRSSVFLRMAYLMPERFRATGVVARRPEAGAAVERDWGLPSFRTVDELLAWSGPTSSSSACHGR